MSVCPNCGKEIEEDAKRCTECGNPVTEERPWDKKAKKTKAELAAEKPAEPRIEDDKLKVQTVIRPDLRGHGLKKLPVNPETYLDSDFLIGMSLCGFSEKPGDKKNLESGTVILTKEALLFGRSEYDIKCGRYKLEIQLNIIDSFGEAVDGGKKLIAIRTVEGQTFYLFVSKREEWLGYFSFALGKEPVAMAPAAPTSAGGEKKKWLLTVIYVLVAFACFTFVAVASLDSFMNTIFLVFGFGFLLLSAFTAFRKKSQ